MIIRRIEEFTRGWLVGDFEPSILKTKDFEVGVLTHKKGEEWPRHVHKHAVEYNVLLSGSMMVQAGRDNEWDKLIEGDVFIIDKNEPCFPVFLEDCKVLVIKVPSVIGDKTIVEV